jgi:hypothetical protein
MGTGMSHVSRRRSPHVHCMISVGGGVSLTPCGIPPGLQHRGRRPLHRLLREPVRRAVDLHVSSRRARRASGAGTPVGPARTRCVTDGSTGSSSRQRKPRGSRRAGTPRECSRLLGGHGAFSAGRPRANLAGRCGSRRAGSRHPRFAVPSLAVACDSQCRRSLSPARSSRAAAGPRRVALRSALAARVATSAASASRFRSSGRPTRAYRSSRFRRPTSSARTAFT